MADKKISQLSGATTPLTGTEELAIVQGGSTVKATAQDVADLAAAPYKVYSILLTKANSGDDPSVTVLQDTVGNVVVSTGFPNGSINFVSNQFLQNKTFFFAQDNMLIEANEKRLRMGWTPNSGGSIVLSTLVNQSVAFTQIFNMPVEIRVYP